MNFWGGVSLVFGAVSGVVVFRLASLWAELWAIFRSVVFQISLALLTLYATSSAQSLFVSSFLLSALSASLFFQYRDFKRGEVRRWFWFLEREPSRGELAAYLLIIGFLLLYSFLNLLP